MVNILITGGNGLIGKKLVERLSEKKYYNLFLITRGNTIHRNKKNIHYINHDLAKPIPPKKLPYNFSVLIHMAAISNKSNFKISEYNSLLTKNLVDFFFKKNITFIFFSSVSVYGEANRKYPITVGDFCKPHSYYGKSKLFDEKLIISKFKRSIILRICPIIEGDDKNLLKRVYIPFTKIKYKSPYERQYSFTGHNVIFEKILELIKIDYDFNDIINLKDEKNYSESEILEKYKGMEIKIPLLICIISFYFLNKLSFVPAIYSINCLMTKMLKSNTYE